MHHITLSIIGNIGSGTDTLGRIGNMPLCRAYMKVNNLKEALDETIGLRIIYK